MSGELNTGEFRAVGRVPVSVFSGAEGVASTMFAHPLGLARTAGFGVRGGECSRCDVCVGVVVFFWDGDAHGAENAFWVYVLWTDGQCTSEPRSGGQA
jgi:hypothetical protein